MKLGTIAETLWGNKARVSYLLIASVVMIFTMLGAREIWTQEHRWANIVMGMYYRQDFLHPYLSEWRYYDKPLLSYWLIVLFAQIFDGLTLWALRLPSALAGLLAIWSIYSLGKHLKDKQLGLLSGGMLLTTYYFVFWARTSSADMLNLAGSLFAVAWYIEKRDHARLIDYVVFFLIVALTSLCKGLGGAIVPIIAVLTDMALQKSWRKHLRWPLFLGMIPGLLIYFSPFWASGHFGGESYGQSGLYLVYKENILRYFQPFDHQAPFFIYFAFLPIYLLPWAFFFIPALFELPSRWRHMSLNSKWIVWTTVILFMFFTLSGSRRSYYVLPIIPFAILLTADWILALPSSYAERKRFATLTVVFSYLVIFLSLDVLSPWYYSKYGIMQFVTTLHSEAEKIQPWDKWRIEMLDGESKLIYYMKLPPDIKNIGVKNDRDEQTSETLLHTWPYLKNKPSNTIFITRKIYQASLEPYFKGYRVVESPHTFHIFSKNWEEKESIAFVPIIKR